MRHGEARAAYHPDGIGGYPFISLWAMVRVSKRAREMNGGVK